MQPVIETERLILRGLLPGDAAGIYELDSNPEVHRYLGRKPITTIEEAQAVIAFIRQQYADNGIGRWAMIEKATGGFMGWTGLKLITTLTNNHINYLDLGYRMMPRYWGKGYATESAAASVLYAFKQLQAKAVYGMADVDNKASRRVLEKAGLRYVETFDYEGDAHDWLRLMREEWEQ
jgi:ribosomal-protein-alanine N-acetyltransferase